MKPAVLALAAVLALLAALPAAAASAPLQAQPALAAAAAPPACQATPAFLAGVSTPQPVPAATALDWLPTAVKFHGHCRCTCSRIPDCNTSADCGGGTCSPFISCC